MQEARRWSPILLKEVAEAYGLSSEDVENLETQDEGEAVGMDMQGFDALLQFSSATKTVAFRTRPKDPQFSVDFSLRTKSRDNLTLSEWDKFRKAAENKLEDQDLPDYYVFAITSNQGIQDCWLYRTDWLVSNIFERENPEEEYPEKPSPNGGMARYIPTEDIESAVLSKLV